MFVLFVSGCFFVVAVFVRFVRFLLVVAHRQVSVAAVAAGPGVDRRFFTIFEGSKSLEKEKRRYTLTC